MWGKVCQMLLCFEAVPEITPAEHPNDGNAMTVIWLKNMKSQTVLFVYLFLFEIADKK